MNLNEIKRIIKEVSAENDWSWEIHGVELYKVPEVCEAGTCRLVKTEYMQICFEIDEVYFYSDLDDLRENWTEEEFTNYIIEGVNERIAYGDEDETFEGCEDVHLEAGEQQDPHQA